MGNPQHRRDHILRVAQTLLERCGFKATTIAEIAKAAGVSVGSVYLEFDSKDAIVRELSERCHHELLERMRGAAQRHGSEPEALQAALEARVLGQHAHARAHPYAHELLDCHACDGVNRAASECRPLENRLVS
ncbi:MAG: helix-turn-helix domain-containing protein, partial [Myxococcota bacterium]